MALTDDERRRRIRAGMVRQAREADAQLTPDLRDAVRALAPTMLKGRVSDEDLGRLVNMGLAEIKLGGPRLTPLGERVAKLNGRF